MSFTVRRVREVGNKEKKSSIMTVIYSLLEMIRCVRKHEQEKEQNKQKKQWTIKRCTVALFSLVVVIIVLITSIVAIGVSTPILQTILSLNGESLPTDQYGRMNIVLLGEGDQTHDGIDLTDTIIIASVKKGEIPILLSIPRDTYILATEKMGKGRINSLYRDYKLILMKNKKNEKEASEESMKALEQTISALTGIEIHRTIKVNFSGFIEAIDQIGGIMITLNTPFIDTEYPSATEEGYETFSLPEGTVTLDGKTALKFARSRHSTSDFSRSARQQLMLTAMVEKLKNDGILSNIAHLSSLKTIMMKNTETTLSEGEIFTIASMLTSIKNTELCTIQLNDQNGLYGSMVQKGGFLYSPPREEFGGAAVLLPVSIPEFPVTWKQVQALTSLVFTHPEWCTKNSPRIVIVNAGAKPGSAGKLGQELEKYGFNIVKTRNLSKEKTIFEKSMSIKNPLQKNTENTTDDLHAWLASTLGYKKSTEHIPGAFEPENADIVLLLGEDFSYSPLQSLLQ